MSAGQRDITIEQGATFVLPFVWKDGNGNPVDLTGYTARMQVRSEHSSSDKLLDLSSPSSGIVIDEPNGKVTVTATAAQTAALSAPQLAVYDLKLTDGAGKVTRVVEGKARITPEVTR